MEFSWILEFFGSKNYKLAKKWTQITRFCHRNEKGMFCILNDGVVSIYGLLTNNSINDFERERDLDIKHLNRTKIVIKKASKGLLDRKLCQRLLIVTSLDSCATQNLNEDVDFPFVDEPRVRRYIRATVVKEFWSRAEPTSIMLTPTALDDSTLIVLDDATSIVPGGVARQNPDECIQHVVINEESQSDIIDFDRIQDDSLGILLHCSEPNMTISQQQVKKSSASERIISPPSNITMDDILSRDCHDTEFIFESLHGNCVSSSNNITLSDTDVSSLTEQLSKVNGDNEVDSIETCDDVIHENKKRRHLIISDVNILETKRKKLQRISPVIDTVNKDLANIDDDSVNDDNTTVDYDAPFSAKQHLSYHTLFYSKPPPRLLFELARKNNFKCTCK